MNKNTKFDPFFVAIQDQHEQNYVVLVGFDSANKSQNDELFKAAHVKYGEDISYIDADNISKIDEILEQGKSTVFFDNSLIEKFKDKLIDLDHHFIDVPYEFPEAVDTSILSKFSMTSPKKQSKLEKDAISLINKHGSPDAVDQNGNIKNDLTKHRPHTDEVAPSPAVGSDKSVSENNIKQMAEIKENIPKDSNTTETKDESDNDEDKENLAQTRNPGQYATGPNVPSVFDLIKNSFLGESLANLSKKKTTKGNSLKETLSLQIEKSLKNSETHLAGMENALSNILPNEPSALSDALSSIETLNGETNSVEIASLIRDKKAEVSKILTDKESPIASQWEVFKDSADHFADDITKASLLNKDVERSDFTDAIRNISMRGSKVLEESNAIAKNLNEPMDAEKLKQLMEAVKRLWSSVKQALSPSSSADSSMGN